MEDGDEEKDEQERWVVQCTECGAAYAARKTEDGTFLPIGARHGCSCGNSEFDEVEHETALEFNEDDEAGRN